MSDSTRTKIIAAVMIATIVWAYFNIGSKKTDTTVPGSPQAVQTVVPEAEVISGTKLVNVEQKTRESWGRDPFKLTENPEKPSTRPSRKLAWVLSGIMYNEQSPVAIINSQPVRQGDVVDMAQVVEIERKAVTLEHNGKRFTLTVTKG